MINSLATHIKRASMKADMLVSLTRNAQSYVHWRHIANVRKTVHCCLQYCEFVWSVSLVCVTVSSCACTCMAAGVCKILRLPLVWQGGNMSDCN